MYFDYRIKSLKLHEKSKSMCFSVGKKPLMKSYNINSSLLLQGTSLERKYKET